jgi:hypothetical protein
MDKEKMDLAMDHLRKMAEGFMGLMGVIGEEVTSFVNKAVSEAKEHKHKHKDKEKSHEDETPPTDETKKE